jgi:hypothetical protein
MENYICFNAFYEIDAVNGGNFKQPGAEEKIRRILMNVLDALQRLQGIKSTASLCYSPF